MYTFMFYNCRNISQNRFLGQTLALFVIFIYLVERRYFKIPIYFHVLP